MQIAADIVMILVQNLVFQNLLGLSPAAVSVKNGKGLLRLGVLTMLCCTLSSVLTAMIRPAIPNLWQKLLFPLCNALICGAFCIILVLLSRKSKHLKRFVIPGIYYAACSSAVLGTMLLSTEYTHDIPVAFRYGFRSGAGYLGVCIMLKMAAPLLYSEHMPQAVRGWKGLLLYAGILSMAAACIFS
ncbi:MAG: hypothetical protein IJM46_08965 [Oscillospiraceae bacterium]|nr:hypothetical protein [Oscillospiraceae bacterium]